MACIMLATLLGVAAVQATPTLAARQEDITPLTSGVLLAFDDPRMVLWNNTTGFKPVASGGDGNAVQYWYVGYDPKLNTVIVAHQGTEFSHVLAVFTDVDVFLGGLDSSLFPGLSSDIKVHSGFRNEQVKTASDILSSVQATISKYGTNSVTLVGHSLGAALSLLDSVYLPLHLPSDVTFRTVLYGLPRVGNQAFADYVDTNLLSVTHINNLKDPVPILPPTFMEYVHPSGEVYIKEPGKWAACPGQDSPSKECIVGDVPNIFVSKPANHVGPYDGIDMHCVS